MIFSKGCGEQLEKTDEGLVYHIPKDGILMINGDLKTGDLSIIAIFISTALANELK